MHVNPIFKFGFKLVVMAGVNQVLKNIIKTTTPVDIKPMEKIFVNIGSLAISDIISSIIANEVVKNIEETIQDIRTSAESSKKISKDIEITTKDIYEKVDALQKEIIDAPKEQTTDSSQ